MELTFTKEENEKARNSYHHRNSKRLLTFVIAMLSCISVSLSQTKGLTLELNNATIERVINQVESQSNYRFLYNKNIVDVNQRISVSVKGATIQTLLNSAFDKTDIVYTINKNQIVLNKKTASESVNGVKGSVRDASGSGVAGVTVMIKGKNTGVITGIDGNFIIKANPNDILTFNMLGYKPVEMTALMVGVNPVVIEEDAMMIEEIVAIGYGSVKKSDLTGAVSNISSAKIMNQAKMNDPIQALQGQIAGADIVSGNAPGSTSSIVIRGYNTLMRSGGDAPLIILDDAPFLGKLNEINPAEIEKIDVLRDASSTAIYGARGANGVIIITTKRGNKDGKISVEYDGFFGMGKNYNDFNVMDGATYAAYRKEAYMNNGIAESFDDVQKRVMESGKYIDWQRVMFDNWSYKTNHNVTINNSVGRNRNMVVLGYNNDQGIIDNMGYERFTARFTGDMELHRNFTMGYSASIAHVNWDVGDPNIWRMGTRMDPVSEMYDPTTGEMNLFTNKWMRDNNMVNPLFGTKTENVNVRVTRNNIAGNLYANWNIIKGLNFKTTLTYNFTNSDDGRYYGKNSNVGNGVRNSSIYAKTKEQQITFSNILNYEKQFNTKHKLNVSLVHDMQKYESPDLRLEGYNIPYFGKWYNVAEAQENITYRSSMDEWALLSFMGRVNYNFKERYLFTVTGRYDGSSRLAKGNKWDFFPSGAFAWRISEEEFLKNSETVSNLKLRLSYGVSGNTAVDTYSTQGQYGRTPYAFGTKENGAWGYAPSVIANPGLGWEKTSELNAGIDFGFFNNRLSGNIDVYQRDTRDLLMERNLPSTSGYTKVWDNVGQVRNKGIEISLQGTPIAKKDFTLTISGNISYNKNEIVKLFNGKEDSPGNNWFIGQPVSIQRLYKFTGVWQQDEAAQAAEYKMVPGKPKFEDVDGSKNMTQEDLFIYNRIPKWLGGLNLNATWKQFDFSAYAYARLGYGGTPGIYTYELGSTRFNQIVPDFWTKENPTNTYPRPEMVKMGELSASDFVWNDYSFVRIKNINIGYTLPKSVVQKIRGKNIRVYLAVDNPFLFTKSGYVGIDPENCNSEADARPLTTYMVGLNVKF